MRYSCMAGNDASMKVILWCSGKSFLVRTLLSRGMTELIPTVRMESQHPIGEPTCHDFPRFVIISEKSRLKSEIVDDDHGFFRKKGSLRANFPKIIQKEFTTSQNHVLCANFGKFGWPEIQKVVRCLPDKKTKHPQGIPRSLLRRLRPLSGPAPNNILGVPQISSKSVHFRRSYSRTREHRWNATQSISNTRRSFFAE